MKLRDIYNRFGETINDPRIDEFSLIIENVKNVLFWALCAFIISIPRGSKGCRTWIILSLIATLLFTMSIQFSDMTIPNFESFGFIFLSHLTEYEVLLSIQRFTPYIFVLLIMLSEYYFVNSDLITASTLEGILKSHAVNIILYTVLIYIYTILCMLI